MVLRLCFCPGDRIYWSGKLGPAIHYRGTPTAFSDFLSKLLVDRGITDVVMLGDGRCYHMFALDVLTGHPSTQPWIIEHGYLRPGLILVENRGTGGRSSAPAAFALENTLPARSLSKVASRPMTTSFLRYALLDIGFHFSNLLAGWLTHPHYSHHALDGPLREYSGWVLKALKTRLRRKRQQAGMLRLHAHKGPVFLLPLQLSTDFQIRHHGTGATLPSIAAGIVESFANAAPKDALLAVKEHPLDNGTFDWSAYIDAEAHRRGVGDRVVSLPGGQVDELLQLSKGVVTVNSTVGLTAIIEQKPCHVLGKAVYNLPGLTDPQPLERFWINPRNPDSDLVARYVEFLRDRFHVEGAFDGPAALVGARNLAARLTCAPVAP